MTIAVCYHRISTIAQLRAKEIDGGGINAPEGSGSELTPLKHPCGMPRP